MAKANKVELGSVQETMLFILWGRAVEAQKEKPLLIDNKAVEIMNSISYDFSSIAENTSRFAQYQWIIRCIYFDDKIKTFINSFPEATIVNIGCGLDTTFYRVDNGKIQWIDLDLPDVIDIRREYFAESERNRFIAKSVFDTSWYDSIENMDHVMLLIAGVLYYLDEGQVKRLFQDFQTYLPEAEAVFDIASKIAVKVNNRTTLRKTDARHIWGISNVNKMENWGCGIKVIDTIPPFKGHKRHYPLIDRIIMYFVDAFKGAALAHVKIHPR